MGERWGWGKASASVAALPVLTPGESAPLFALSLLGGALRRGRVEAVSALELVVKGCQVDGMSSVPESVNSKTDFVQFVEGLRADLTDNPDEWENPTLDRFLQKSGRDARAPSSTSRSWPLSIPSPTLRIPAGVEKFPCAGSANSLP